MPDFKTIDDMGDVRGRVVLVRVDFNVPCKDGKVSDDTRLRAAVPSVQALRDKGAIIALLSHFGRPKGKVDPAFSLRPIAPAFAAILGQDVTFIEDCQGDASRTALAHLAPGSVALLENTRFHPGEEKNDPDLARAMADLGQFYVNDAFSAAHRAHVSTEGLAHLLPAFAGRSLERELKALDRALGQPVPPVVAVVGGAKISTKLAILEHLVERVDHLIIGGAMANSFLYAHGAPVGRSLCEKEMKDTVLAVMARAEACHCQIHLPYEVVVARKFEENAENRVVSVREIADDEMILDVAPSAVEAAADVFKTCRTLIWNGPMGAFEVPPFDRATVALAQAAAALTKDDSLVSIAGGGDTVAALAHAGVVDEFSFVSVAGGAFLEWMEGRVLPGVAALGGTTLSSPA